MKRLAVISETLIGRKNEQQGVDALELYMMNEFSRLSRNLDYQTKVMWLQMILTLDV